MVLSRTADCLHRPSVCAAPAEVVHAACRRMTQSGPRGSRIVCCSVCLPNPTDTVRLCLSVVEDDEDDFPSTRTDGEFLHGNGSKEKRES